MSSWASRDDISPSEWDATPSEAHNVCGFAACAMGHAAFYPPLRKAGLGIRFKAYSSLACITYKGRVVGGFSTAEKFFGISEYEAERLFCPDHYSVKNIKPKHVIQRIDKLLKKYGAEK